MNEILTFVRELCQNFSLWERGTDRRGETKGSDNEKLVNNMADIRSVSDLQALRASGSSDILQTVEAALRRLEERRVIPASGVTAACLGAAYATLRRTKKGLSNQELFQQLWTAADTKPALRPYVDTVTRLWLISPADGVVQAMQAVATEIVSDR